jgi:transposase
MCGSENLKPARYPIGFGTNSGRWAFRLFALMRVMPTRSDENDAKGLAEMARMGWYPQAAVKGAENWKTRSMLAARTKLMNLRGDIDNQMRRLCKGPGIVLGNGGPARSSARIGR